MAVLCALALVVPVAGAQEPTTTTPTSPPTSGSTPPPAPTTTSAPASTVAPAPPPAEPTPPTTETPAPPPGPTPEEIEALRRLQEQYDEAVAAESLILAEYELSIAEQERLSAEIESVTKKIERTSARLEQKRLAAASAEAVATRIEVELEERRSQMAEARFRLRRQSVDSFVMGENLALEAFLGADNATEAMLVSEFSKAIVDKQTANIETAERLEAEIESLSAEVSTARAEAQAEREKVAAASRRLRAQREELDVLHFIVGVEVTEQRTRLSQIQNRKRDFEARLNALEADSDGVAAVLVEWQAEQEAEPAGRLLPPLGDIRSGSGFGPRVHPIFGSVRMHNGLDMGAPSGMPIRSVADGVVVMAMARQGFGNVIVIDHGGRIASLYAHQSAFEVGFGEEVVEGQIIGYVGSTGYSTGPHLHLELRSFGKPINPAPYVDYTREVDCEYLIDSDHPADVELLDTREDCLILTTAE